MISRPRRTAATDSAARWIFAPPRATARTSSAVSGACPTVTVLSGWNPVMAQPFLCGLLLGATLKPRADGQPLDRRPACADVLARVSCADALTAAVVYL